MHSRWAVIDVLNDYPSYGADRYRWRDASVAA
jgi:hypothetical protein